MQVTLSQPSQGSQKSLMVEMERLHLKMRFEERFNPRITK